MSSLHDVYFCQMDRTEELSKRMANRNIPDTQLDTAYFSRPSSTRFVKFPTVDNRKKSTIEKAIMKEFSVETSFNPGTSAPFSGYQKNVDVENKLIEENVEFPAGRLESDTRDFTVRLLTNLDTVENFKDLVIKKDQSNSFVKLEVVKL